MRMTDYGRRMEDNGLSFRKLRISHVLSVRAYHSTHVVVFSRNVHISHLTDYSSGSEDTIP